MKKLLSAFIFLITTIFINSQTLQKLDSVSASNLYVSTNKKQVLTKYETCPETFILFYGDGNVSNLENYDFIAAFNTKDDLLGFLNMVERSITKSKMIIHHMEKDNVRLKGVTSHTAEINVNKYDFYLNDVSIEKIRKQLE